MNMMDNLEIIRDEMRCNPDPSNWWLSRSPDYVPPAPFEQLDDPPPPPRFSLRTAAEMYDREHPECG
jgi:hypothetical protein